MRTVPSRFEQYPTFITIQGEGDPDLRSFPVQQSGFCEVRNMHCVCVFPNIYYKSKHLKVKSSHVFLWLKEYLIEPDKLNFTLSKDYDFNCPHQILRNINR